MENVKYEQFVTLCRILDKIRFDSVAPWHGLSRIILENKHLDADSRILIFAVCCIFDIQERYTRIWSLGELAAYHVAVRFKRNPDECLDWLTKIAKENAAVPFLSPEQSYDATYRLVYCNYRDRIEKRQIRGVRTWVFGYKGRLHWQSQKLGTALNLLGLLRNRYQCEITKYLKQLIDQSSSGESFVASFHNDVFVIGSPSRKRSAMFAMFLRRDTVGISSVLAEALLDMGEDAIHTYNKWLSLAESSFPIPIDLHVKHAQDNRFARILLESGCRSFAHLADKYRQLCPNGPTTFDVAFVLGADICPKKSDSSSRAKSTCKACPFGGAETRHSAKVAEMIMGHSKYEQNHSEIEQGVGKALCSEGLRRLEI